MNFFNQILGFITKYFSFIFRLNLKLKIIGFTLISSFAAIILILTLFSVQSKLTLGKFSEQQLISIGEITKQRLVSYFENSDKLTARLAKNRLIEGMIFVFESNFYAAGFDPYGDHSIYVDSYKKLDQVFGKRIRKMMKEYRFHNLLLVSQDSQVIFSSNTKSSILGKNLNVGLLKNSKLQKCYTKAAESKESTVFFSDYEIIKGSKQVGAFLCVKQYAEFDHSSEGVAKGEAVGVVITQIDLPYINSITTQRHGMGKTGQAYIVGQDKYLRSDLFVNKTKYNVQNSLSKNLLIQTDSVNQGLSGKTKTHYSTDANEKIVLSYVTPLKAWGRNWVILAEKEKSEIFEPVERVKRTVAFYTLLLSLITIAFSYLFGRMISNTLSKIANKLSSASDRISNVANQLSQGSVNLAERAKEQAASLQHTAATFEEITSTVRQTSDNSKNVAKLSQDTLKAASEGRKASNKVQIAIDGIADSSKEIAGIVNLVEEIAFQTNILAINAAIEAAKAGEQGKGFAVVAIEVRDLAQRSADAANDIKKLIGNSIKQVDSSVSLVNDSTKKLGHISTNIETVTQLIDEISKAAEEQYIGVESLNTTVVKLGDNSQENADFANSSSQASNGLLQDSDNLLELVNNLRKVIGK